MTEAKWLECTDPSWSICAWTRAKHAIWSCVVGVDGGWAAREDRERLLEEE
jgi:hypothetical protein